MISFRLVNSFGKLYRVFLGFEAFWRIEVCCALCVLFVYMPGCARGNA